jgi:hypothetical protein
MKLLLSFIQAALFVALTFGLQNTAQGAGKFVAASSQYLSVSSPVSDVPITMACWFNIPNVTTSNALMCVNNLSDQSKCVLYARGDVAGDPVRVQTADSTGLAFQADTTTGFSASTWSHACGVFTSTTSRTAYLNGGSSATNTTSRTVTTLTQLNIGAQAIATFPSGTTFTGGDIAEVGVWNVALTDAEVASLAKGFTCDQIRPQSLVFYAPLIRNFQDVKGGRAISNNNTVTVSDHPRVYQ